MNRSGVRQSWALEASRFGARVIFLLGMTPSPALQQKVLSYFRDGAHTYSLDWMERSTLFFNLKGKDLLVPCKSDCILYSSLNIYEDIFHMRFVETRRFSFPRLRKKLSHTAISSRPLSWTTTITSHWNPCLRLNMQQKSSRWADEHIYISVI